MLSGLISTDNDTAIAIVRIVLGALFLVHGSQKMLGWFGGDGFSATMDFFTKMMRIPAPLALLAVCAEFFGGLGLTVGLLARVAAFGIAATMVGSGGAGFLPLSLRQSPSRRGGPDQC